MVSLKQYAFILVFSCIVQLEAVTVNPLAPMCPTNKVAPRRKRYDSHPRPRTFGEYYNLLAPNSPSSLQEKPQEDAPDDCGEIDDYDENDIGSVTQGPNRRLFHRIIKGQSPPANYHLLNQHSHHGIRPSTAPPNRPTRPPPAGYFGTNTYTAPIAQEPTDYVKPVAEAGYQDPQMIYKPGMLVGGPLGHIVGLPQKKGSKPYSTPANAMSNNREPKYPHHHPYVPSTYQPNVHKNHRPRKYNGDTGILGSFVDLFF